MHRYARVFTLPIAACFALAACSSTSTNPGVPGASPVATLSAQSANAQFVVTVPAAGASSSSAARRAPLYLSSGTRSVVVTLQSLGGQPPPATTKPVVIPIGANADCVTANAGTTCTMTVPGFVGTDVFLVNASPSTDGSGTPLSSGTIAVALVAAATTQVFISETMSSSLAPTATAISLSAAPASLAAGVAGAATITVNETDSSGATILGTPFASPVTLSVPPGTSAFTLSIGGSTGAASVALSSSSAVTVIYDGTTAATPAVFTAASAGSGSQANALTASIPIALGGAPVSLPSAPATLPPGTPGTQPTAAPTLPPNTGIGIVANVTEVDVNDVNATSTFVAQQNGFGGPFTFSIADPTIASATVGSDGATFTVTGLLVGATTILVTGANGQTLSLPINVTQTPITIQTRNRK